MSGLTPHPIAVAQADLDDLRDRLGRTRWPEREAVDDWSQGIPLAYVQELCAHWADGYDWRRVEAELNRFEQLRFTPDVGAPDTVGVQVLHAPSPHPGALPLVLTHGWPGSVVEFLDVVEPLRDPVATAATRPTRSTSCARRCPATGSATSRRATGWGVERIADGVGRADGRPRLRLVRRPGRRLGLGGHDGARRQPRRPRRRHPPQHGVGRAGQGPAAS